MSAKRRLAALESAAGNTPDCENLLQRARAGRLADTELDALSDEQLWWVATDSCSPLPTDGAVIDRALTQIARL